MRKPGLIILILLAVLFPLPSVSVMGEELVNPFPSEENLSLFDFEQNGAPDLSDWQINLVTTRTGAPVYAYFGHTSLEIVDPDERSFFYDYGFFTFKEGFYLNFAKGLLYYNMYPSDGRWRMKSFTDEDRTVWKTPLTLTSEQKYGIIKFLEYNAREENSTYLYHYYNDNCATRVRDIINAATGGDFRRWAESIDSGHSLRSSAAVFMDKDPIASFAINAVEGPSIDLPISLWDAMYLPEALERGVELYTGVDSEMVYETSFRVDKRTMPLFVSSLLAGTVLSVLLYTTRKFQRRRFERLMDFVMAIVYIAAAAIGIVSIFLMLATNHDVAYFNENFLYLSPLLLISAFESLRGKKFNKRYCIARILLTVMVTALILKWLMPTVFIQANAPVFALMMPLHIAEILRHRIPKEEK